MTNAAGEMTATGWYILGCGSGAFLMLVACMLVVVAIWPDLKQFRPRGRG